MAVEALSARPSGFSLVELLVAVAVFALAVLALLNLVGQSVRSAALVEERTIGGIVADTLASEAMLVDVQSLMRAADGREDAGGRAWRWTRRASAVDGDLLRVDIQVRLDADGQTVADAVLLRSLR